MKLVDANGNPIQSGKVETTSDDYTPEYIGSVFGLVNKLTQKPEASFLFLTDAKVISDLSLNNLSQNAFMSIVASYAAFTYAIKIKKISKEDFEKTDAVALKEEMLSRLEIVPLGSLPFDALFELNPEVLTEMSDTLNKQKEGE